VDHPPREVRQPHLSLYQPPMRTASLSLRRWPTRPGIRIGHGRPRLLRPDWDLLNFRVSSQIGKDEQRRHLQRGNDRNVRAYSYQFLSRFVASPGYTKDIFLKGLDIECAQSPLWRPPIFHHIEL
jgi:hypothetical protein